MTGPSGSKTARSSPPNRKERLMMDEKKPTATSGPQAEAKPESQAKTDRPATPKAKGNLALKGEPSQIRAAADNLERAGLVVVKEQEFHKHEPVQVQAREGFACPVCGNTKDFSLVSNGVRCDNCQNTLLIDSPVKNHWQRKG